APVQSGEPHAVVAVVVHVVAGHHYTTGRAILQLDTAAIVIVHVAIGDRDVALEAVPDHDAAGRTEGGGMTGYIKVVQGHIVHRTVGIESAASNVVLQGNTLHEQIMIASPAVDAGELVRAGTCEVADGHIGD